MHILVLNGSPKGKYSITLQTVLYLEAQFPEHTFEVLHVGQSIRAYEKDFSKAKQSLLLADAILFSYPVYTFLAPSQLHRFIELIKASGVDLRGKAATQITTSKHFYDTTAHAYIRDNCHDLGLRYVKGLSADMEDLTSARGREEAESFFAHFLFSVREGIFERAPQAPSPYESAMPTLGRVSAKRESGDVVILTDLAEGDATLAAMIAAVQERLVLPTRVIHLREYPFSGGCLGCFRCAVSGKCIHKDGFDTYLRETIQTASAIVYALRIRDHSMGACFKTYDDRQFCNGHRTVTVGMPVGYLVAGNLDAEPNLRLVIEGRAEVGQNYIAGIVTDAPDVDRQIDELCENLTYALDHRYRQPSGFLGVGGMKIFRDLIWRMRGLMRADHAFYKKHGIYDFPQKQPLRALVMYPLGWMLGSPKILAKIGNKMNEGMVAPYRKVVERARSCRAAEQDEMPR